MKSRAEIQNIWLWILRVFEVRRQPKRWHVGQLTRWLLGWRRGWRLCQRPNCQEGQEAAETDIPAYSSDVPENGVPGGISTNSDLPDGVVEMGRYAELGTAEHNALVRRLIAEYRSLSGGEHWRLVTMQRDFADLVRMHFFAAVWDGRVIAYFPADRVPPKYAGLIVSLERLESLHRDELRKSAARWN